MKILVVDDNPIRIKKLCKCLKTLYGDVSMQCFDDPLLAIKHNFFDSADALYSSLELKRLDGYELAKQLRKKTEQIEINFVVSEKDYPRQQSDDRLVNFTVSRMTSAGLLLLYQCR